MVEKRNKLLRSIKLPITTSTNQVQIPKRFRLVTISHQYHTSTSNDFVFNMPIVRPNILIWIFSKSRGSIPTDFLSGQFGHDLAVLQKSYLQLDTLFFYDKYCFDHLFLMWIGICNKTVEESFSVNNLFLKQSMISVYFQSR